MEFLARVNPKYFAAMELFAAKQDVRYYLNGVCIEPHPEKGAIIVATNGHRLAAIHDPDGWCKETIIVGGIPRALVAACKVKGNPLKLTEPKQLWISKGGAVLMATDDQTPPTDPFNALALHANKITIVDGQFPNWRRILPTKRELKADHFPALNPKYLADFQRAAEILYPNTKKFGGCLRLEARGEELSVVVRIPVLDLLDRFVGIVMPVRAEPLPTIVPSWLMPKQKPRVKFRGGALVTE